MKTVTLDVRAPGDALGDLARVWKTGRPEKSARISFATPELLRKVLTAKRRELLKAMCGAGPMSMREAARRVGRDVKAVHSDITALLNAGVLDRIEDGRIVFPFDAERHREEDSAPVERLLRGADRSSPIFGSLR